MAKQPENAAAETAEVPKKKGKKLILIAGVLVLALGGGGAGAWYFMRPADTHDEVKTEPEKPAQFLALESFTVNLASSDGTPQYLQAGLTLKLKHDMKVEAIKERMPEIRNRILLILSGKKASDLLPLAGKQQLATELSDTVRDIVGDAGGAKAPKKVKAKAKAEDEETADKGEEDKSDAKSKSEDKADAKAKAEDKADAKAKAEDKAEAKTKTAKKAKAAATEVAKNDIEVLFTSFIIQ